MNTPFGSVVNCQVIMEKGKTFIPAKVVLNALGQEIVYDKSTKKVGLNVRGVFKALEILTKENIDYMSLDELQGLGYTILQENGYIIIQ